MSIFAGLLDARVAISEKLISETPAAKFPEEAHYVAGAVEKRRREFLTGRACAHEALAKLSAASAPILAGQDRAPIWPQGFIGSITHSDSYAAAAVTRSDGGILSIGIDLEPAEPLPLDLWETVCLPEERAWLEGLPSAAQGLLARAIFSAKECAFKAQFPLTHAMLEFEEIGVTVDLDRGLFTASFLSGAPQSSAEGRIRIANGLLACAIAL